MSDELTPEQVLATRILDVLGLLHPRALADLRRPEGPRIINSLIVSRTRMGEVVRAFEAVYPGALDDFVKRLAETKD